MSSPPVYAVILTGIYEGQVYEVEVSHATGRASPFQLSPLDRDIYMPLSSREAKILEKFHQGIYQKRLK
jgi:hypothetical protein